MASLNASELITMNDKMDINVSLLWTPKKAINRTQANTEENITYVDYYLHRPSVAAVFIISYLLIFILCMVGNGVVCFIVLSNKHMRTITNLFILNLAVSDLLVGIFCMPTTLLDNIIAEKNKLFDSDFGFGFTQADDNYFSTIIWLHVSTQEHHIICNNSVSVAFQSH
ncbi:unnamed protein product [Ranitomeya imitator]|uniref:G-protein coupled receptors family 1 profile domain-containing protein n=1 Tax=Ranitomeya imitator TaxID=111125 RepID=A0ABN9MJ04_9NEOB|nr:unnamed protein product [Ranitomeya imitator]